MTITLTPYMSYIVIITVAVGKWIKPLFKDKFFYKNKNIPLSKLLMPILLIVATISGYIIGHLIYGTPVGESLLQGLISGILSEYGYDNVKGFLSNGRESN